jgi:hypothetical protein
MQCRRNSKCNAERTVTVMQKEQLMQCRKNSSCSDVRTYIIAILATLELLMTYNRTYKDDIRKVNSDIGKVNHVIRTLNDDI